MYSEKRQSQLIGFLREELNVSDSFILLALRLRKYKLEPISMILWQYGLITLRQLEKIFDWLEH